MIVSRSHLIAIVSLSHLIAIVSRSHPIGIVSSNHLIEIVSRYRKSADFICYSDSVDRIPNTTPNLVGIMQSCQWRNEAPGAPASPEGAVIGGRQIVIKMWDNIARLTALLAKVRVWFNN